MQRAPAVRFIGVVLALVLGATLLAGCQSGGQPPAGAPELEAARSRLAQCEETLASLQNDLEAAQAELLRQGQIAAGLRADLEAAQSQLQRQSQLVAEMEARAAASRVRPFSHEGLFYDPEHVAQIRLNPGQAPWNTALQELKSKADKYLTFIPEPIHGRWYVPSPNEDPATQDAAVRPLEESTNAMLYLAQYYLFSGEAGYADRAAQVADAWTASLMELENEQALYQAGWEMLAMAVAADMLRGYDGWSTADRRAFEDWLNERTWHIIARNDALNNHQYWTAAQAAAVGVLTDDPGLYEWALAAYRKAIALDILPDGHMPRETARGQLGIFYQNFAIEPLVLVAEVARRQGVDLWSYAYQGKDLRLAIDYLLRFFDGPEAWPWSQEPQDMSFFDAALGGKKVGWLEMAYYRYRDPEIAEYLLEQRPVFDRRAGGMTTLTHGVAIE